VEMPSAASATQEHMSKLLVLKSSGFLYTPFCLTETSSCTFILVRVLIQLSMWLLLHKLKAMPLSAC